jgi:O-antigen ligase
MKSALRTPPAYRWLDEASGWVSLFLVVWAPWALGCAVTWAINVLVSGCYTLGGLLALKAFIRWRAGYTPERWVQPTPAGRRWLWLLATLTVLFLGWVLAGAANGRGYIEISRAGPILHAYDREPLAWLPASLDAPYSWRAFWRWTSFALAFWALRDWLVGKSRREKHHAEDYPFPTARVRLLLWTLALSGAALALTGILQRLDGTSKLLWLVQPVINKLPEAQFGSYPYRANAAQYFNLIWPAVLGFWWALHAQTGQQNPKAKLGNDPSVLLLPAVMLMMAVPVVATTRGGALILVALTGGVVVVAACQRRVTLRLRLALGLVLVGALALGWVLGGAAQQRRFATVFDDQMSGRTEAYKTGWKMAEEFGWRGSGAETFSSLNFLYRDSLEEKWQGYLHDDWLETYVTLGGVGLVLVLLSLGGVVAVFWTSTGARAPAFFSLGVGLGLVGLLVHAKFDFPFQMESLRFTFLVMLAVLLASPVRAAAR